MFEAVLFDLDDTLTDWPGALEIAIDAGLDVLGVAGEPLARRGVWDEIRSYTHVRRDGLIVDRAYWKLLFEPQVPFERAFPLEPRVAVKGAVAAFRSALNPAPFAETGPALEALQATGRTLGVLSNNPMAAFILRQHGLAARFSAVVTPDEPYRKPHPRAFAEVCQAVGLAPSVCAYVGDSYLNDVEGAHAAGLTAVWLDRLGDDYPLPAGAFRVTSLLDPRLLV